MTATVPGPAHSVDDIRLALRSWPEVETYLESCKAQKKEDRAGENPHEILVRI